MARGRPPKPSHLRAIEGNPGHRPINKNEPMPKAASGPKPPPELNADARKEWRRIVPELTRLQLLTVLDLGVLAQLCQCYGRWIEAERQLKLMKRRKTTTAGGLLIVTSNGNFVQNPLVGIANVALRDYQTACAKFGLTPSDRTRLSMPEPDKPDTKPDLKAVAGSEFFDD